MNHKLPRSVLYVLALSAAVLAYFVYRVLTEFIGSPMPTYFTFYPTVITVALLAGFGPACAAILTATLLTVFAIFPLTGQTPVLTLANIVPMGFFITTCLVMSGIAELYRRSRHRLQEQIDRRTAELRGSTETLHLAMESAMAGFWEWHLETNANVWSEELWGLYGIEPHSCTPSYDIWLQTVHPDDRMRIAEAVQQAAAAGVPLNVEWRVTRNDGTGRWLMSRGKPHKNREGKIVRYVGVVIDITERKTSEELIAKARRELEERVRERTIELENSREQLRRLYMHLQSLREDERKTIAREIHDELGQMLTALKINLSLAKKDSGSDVAGTIRTLETNIRYIDEGIRSVKRICSSLRPDILENLGLAAAIETQCEELDRLGISCDVKLPVRDLVLPHNTDIVVYRIVQEAFTNILRHAGSTCVRVTLLVNDAEAVLRITDNGRGITPEDLEKHGAFGLMGMKERVTSMGGRFRVRGMKNRGTTMVAALPLAGGNAHLPAMQ